MRIVYITMAKIDLASGVFKKICAQQKALVRLGHECQIVFLPQISGDLYRIKESPNSSIKSVRNIKFLLDNCDVSYVRFELLRHSSFRDTILRLKRTRKAIYLEIPTYPPYQESIARGKEHILHGDYLQGIRTYLGSGLVLMDTYILTYLAKKVVLIADDKKFFLKESVRIENGIDLDINIFQKRTPDPQTINIIAVSNFAVWNGYDRAIKGLANYRNKNIQISLTFVGDIDKAEDLINLTKKLHLDHNVHFVGALSDKKLDQEYLKADLALCALGNHRRKVFANSSLKAKEYAARGMLMIMDESEGIEKEIQNKSFIVKADESPIDFSSIASWFCEIESKDSVRKFINEFAKHNYSWEIQMKKVFK